MMDAPEGRMRTCRIMRTMLVAACLVAATACSKKDEVIDRVLVVPTGGSTFQLKPTEGQFPYCLAYTVSQKTKVIRQLTMRGKNVSFECPAGQPIGRRTYRVPAEDGPVRIWVLFTSQQVNAGSIAQQLVELPDRTKLNVLDLRVVGNAAIEAHDFAPEEDVAPEVGGILGADAGAAPPADAGPAADDAGATR